MVFFSVKLLKLLHKTRNGISRSLPYRGRIAYKMLIFPSPSVSSSTKFYTHTHTHKLVIAKGSIILWNLVPIIMRRHKMGGPTAG